MAEQVGLLEEISTKIGAKDLTNLEPKQVGEVITLAGKKKLTPQHIQALIEIAPKFLDMGMKSIESMLEIAKGGQKVQKRTLDAIERTLSSLDNVVENLKILIQNADTQHSKELAEYSLEAARMIVDVADKIRQINDGNNATTIKVTSIIGTAFTVVGGLIIWLATGGKRFKP